MNRIDDIPAYKYPPNEWLASISWLPLTQHLTVIRAGCIFTIIIASIEYLWLSGLPNTPVPFNYPFYLDILFVFVALYTLEALHKQLDTAKRELILLSKISKEKENIPDDEVPDEEEIRDCFETRFDRALDLVKMGISAIILGTLVLVITYVLNILNFYPYLAMSFMYGASHGILIPYILILPFLLIEVPRDFMNDLNVIDPVGVGGYPEVAASIGKAAWYGTVIANIDFLILGSAAFLGDPRFQTIVVIIYIVELLLLFGFTIGGTFYIRNIMKRIRDERIRQLQWRFGISEGAFLSDNPDEGQEKEDMLEIITYSILFDRLNEMNLMPVNMVWWTRFIGSALATVAVIFTQLILVIDLSDIIFLFIDG